MSTLYACGFDGSWLYRERIEISDGNVTCCESGIRIPKGHPFVNCQPVWSDDEDLEDLSAEDQEAKYFDSSMPQCIEVWRLLRRNNRVHGACAAFGCAIDQYTEALDDAWGGESKGMHFLRLRELHSVIKRTSNRYKPGLGPRLHPSEIENLRSGKWLSSLPHTVRLKDKGAA